MTGSAPDEQPIVRIASVDEPADVAALAEVRFAWCHDEGGESGSLDAFAPAFGVWWHDHADTHLAFLAELAGRPVGMAWLGIIDRVPGPERFNRRSGMLQSVYVRPELRDRTIGSALVDSAIAYARQARLGYLMVHPSEHSYPLYERAGFAATRRVLELGLTEPR